MLFCACFQQTISSEVLSQLLKNDEPNHILIDCYFNFMQKLNPNITPFPVVWVNDFFLETNSKELQFLKGFAFTKAMKLPWKNTITAAIRELTIKYKHHTESWKVSTTPST